jgi:hypothetical protein
MYAFVNTLAHKFNIYPLLQNSVYFFNRTFIKKTHYPIISIIIFIIVIVLNSIQYANNKYYLQDKLDNADDTNLGNTLLYIYDFIGINGFLNNGLVHILFFILTYFCISLIELNIGHLALLFLLFIDLMFQFFWDLYQDVICYNYLRIRNRIDSSPYCCGSFILFMSLGFVLSLILMNITNIYICIFTLFVIICVFVGCVLYEHYIQYEDTESGDTKTCLTYTWHGANYAFGILCALVLGNY